MRFEAFDRSELLKEIALKRSELVEIRKKRVELECDIRRLNGEYNESLEINKLLAKSARSIFKWLDFNDLLAAELVCEKWNRYVKQLNIEQLVISKRLLPHPIHTRATEIRPISCFFFEDENYFPSTPLRLTNSRIELKNSFMLNLKRLRIWDEALRFLYREKINEPLLTNAKFVNQFVNLEIFETSRIEFDLDRTLSLPELKYLAIGQSSSTVVIDCPKLTHYQHQANTYRHVEFRFPETVTHLYAVHDLSEYEVFKNLQYMCLSTSRFEEKGDCTKYEAIEFLGRYRKLKQLSLRPDKPDERVRGYKGNRGSFLQLLKQKRIFARDDLELIFYGIRLNNAAQLENQAEDVCSMLSKLYIRNCTKLCESELLWIRSLNYTAMMEATKQRPIKIPLDIHEKLFNVRTIVLTDEVKDEEHFFQFVKGFKKVVAFRLEGKVPSEAFFERLATNCASRWYVELEFDRKASMRHLAEFNFIFKFKNLARLEMGRDLKNEFIKKAFDCFDSFELHLFIGDYFNIKIVRKSRSSKHEYFFKRNRKDNYNSFDRLDDLLKELNGKFEREDYDPAKNDTKSDEGSDHKRKKRKTRQKKRIKERMQKRKNKKAENNQDEAVHEDDREEQGDEQRLGSVSESNPNSLT